MFYNTQSGQCEMCPLAYYQDQLGQLECKYCGEDYTTVHVRSVSQQDCVGRYQDQLDQLECKYCGEDNTTVHVRSVSQLDCVGK